MKRKYIFLGIVASLVMMWQGCSLDYDPVDVYSDVTEGVTETGKEVVFKDKAAVLSHVQSFYSTLRDRQEHWYLDLMLIAESHSDNAYAGAPNAEVLPFENNSIEGSNSVIDRDWSRYLADVAKANKLIVNIDDVTDASLTAAERNEFKAVAKIFRAMVYFDMVRLWGSVPVITTVAGDITSETIEEVYPQYFPSQNTEEEVYRQIEKDLLESLEFAPANSTSDKTKLSKSVARALLAKVYAEKPIRDYEKVIQYADQLAADGFGLVDDFSDLFGMNADNTDAKARNTKESILEMQYFAGNGNWVTWMFGRDLINWNSNFSWTKWVTPSRDLIAAFTSEGDAKRMNESIVYYKCDWSNYYPKDHYPFMYKCRSAYSSILKFRYADILLLKAEALIMKTSPDLTAAAALIDQIRQRVDLPKLTSAAKASQSSMIDALLKERRLEMAFEAQRWFDLVRLDKVESVMNSLWSRDVGRKEMRYAFGADSYRLPIPQAAMDQNPNLVQNPGY